MSSRMRSDKSFAMIRISALLKPVTGPEKMSMLLWGEPMLADI